MEKIEHIGIAVKSLEESNKLFAQLFGKSHYKVEAVESEGVSTSFFEVGPNKIELLEATKLDSPIAKFIEKKGEGIHHIAFAVDDIESEIQKLDKKEVLVGQWIDESPYALGIVTIIERGSKTIIKLKIKEHESEKVAIVKQQGKMKRLEEVGNDFGEYYLLDSNGNLSIYDNDGLIIKYKKIK